MDQSDSRPARQTTMPDGPDSFPARGVNSLASPGSRGMARLLDLTVLSVPLFVAYSIAALVASGGSPDPETTLASESAYVWMWGSAIGLAVVYETICVTLWGQTLGKLVLGLRVVRQVNGRCPLWWEAAIRIALPGAVAVIPSPLAKAAAVALYIVAVSDPIRRSVPDRAAGTVVVRSR